jgi:hypothetical protein
VHLYALTVIVYFPGGHLHVQLLPNKPIPHNQWTSGCVVNVDKTGTPKEGRFNGGRQGGGWKGILYSTISPLHVISGCASLLNQQGMTLPFDCLP